MINDEVQGDLIPAAESDNHEDVHEEVNNVQVDVQGSKDVFLRANKGASCIFLIYFILYFLII